MGRSLLIIWCDTSKQTSKQIRLVTLRLRLDLYDYSDVCIIVKENITITEPNDKAYSKNLAFKNLFFAYKKNNTLIDNADINW